jgi:hypothetical protein
MRRHTLLSFASLLLLSAACSSNTDGPNPSFEGNAGDAPGGASASAGAQVSAGGAAGAAGRVGSGGQLGNAGSAAGGAPDATAGGAASAGAGANGGAGIGGAHSAGGSGANSGGANGTSGTHAGGATAHGGTSSGGAGSTSCPGAGHITYTLAKSASPTATEQTAYDKITTAMDKAITYYDCYTSITKSLNVSYVPSVETADGNYNGSIRFGSNTTYMDYRTAMHEIAHTVGIGQASNWGSFVSNGLFTGTHAAAQLDAINATLTTPLYTELHADTQHFWPYGLNQQSEVKSEADLIFHCEMVVAIREDLGLK